MSKIPFVNALGDSIERAASGRVARTRSHVRWRLTAGALGLALLVGGTAAATGVFSDPDLLASQGVGCYDRPSLSANVSVQSAGAGSPLETCRSVLKTDRPLVACASQGHVAVFPGDSEVCERLGLNPLPANYGSARARVLAFGAEVNKLEQAADCIVPAELAQQVQGVLDRSGWKGWRAEVHPNISEGPCGSVTSLGGDGTRAIEGSLSAPTRQVFVIGGPSRSLANLLYDGPRPLAAVLPDMSGKRCFSEADLRAIVRKRFAPTGRSVSFTHYQRPDGVEYGDARRDRLAEGCAVVANVTPAQDGKSIVVEIERPGVPAR